MREGWWIVPQEEQDRGRHTDSDDEMTIPTDVEILAEAMFRDTSLDELLDSLKHDYDYMVNWETRRTTGRDRG